MTRTFTGRGWILLSGAAVACAGLVAAVCDLPRLALVNETPSLPRGLYLRRFGVTAGRGAVVAAPQPAGARIYLRQLGAPPDGLLLKRVAAVAGDPVCRRGDRLVLAGKTAPILVRDRRGVALPSWSGCRDLAPGEVFLLGDTEASFDSRYFGPVQRDQLQGVYREAVTW